MWDFVLAFLIQFAPDQMFEIYGLYLPLIFIAIACLAYLALADTLFQRSDMAYFAFLIQGFFWLSTINLSTADNGLGLLARILQDKFAALLLILPLIQLCSLKFLQNRISPSRSYAPRGDKNHFLIMASVLAIVAVLIHPIAIMWLIFSLGSLAVFILWQYRRQFSLKPQWIGIALTLASLAVGFAWWQRSTRPDYYYSTADGNLHALTLSVGRVLFLSLEKDIYMAHPNMLNHPLIILALLLTLTLIPKLKTQNIPAQFLFANSFAIIAILFNPVTAPLLGRIISFWIIYRIVWILPISLTLAYVLYPRLEQIAAYINHRLLKTPQLAGLTLACIALALYGRILTSWYTLNAWQPVTITAAEVDVSQQVAKLGSSDSRILASHDLNIRLTSTANQIHPMTARLYGQTDPKLLDTRYFLNSSWLNESLYNDLLPRYQVRHILTRQTDLIEPQLRLFPHLFKLLYANTDYSLYEWQVSTATSLDLTLFKANGLQSQPNEAQQLYETILQQNPTYLPAILSLAAVHEQQFRFDQALALYQTAAPQTDFERAWLQVKLTQAHHRTSDLPEIIDGYRQALDLAQGHEAVYQQF
jgi:tetratricopeptide (TPR) repeat protein